MHLLDNKVFEVIVSNLSSVPFVFCQFFTWIALFDVNLRFSLMLVRKADTVLSLSTWAASKIVCIKIQHIYTTTVQRNVYILTAWLLYIISVVYESGQFDLIPW